MNMKRLTALLLALLLCICLSAGAFADNDSNPGGTPVTPPHAPTTGPVLVIALSAVAVGAGTVFFITSRKSK